MPAAFELLFLVAVGYRNIMPYSRVCGNKNYGFGALGKLQGSRISIFVIDERAVFLV